MRILIVDDDIDLANAVQAALRKVYSVDVAFTATDGLYRTQINAYDAVILDVNLPDMSGQNVCATLRSQGIVVPILMLTGVSDTIDKVAALDAGADDYLTKPFDLEELQARIRALLRRPPQVTSNILALEDLLLDTTHRTVNRGGEQVTLRKKEFELLEYLVRNKNRAVTRAMILEHVWDESADPYSNTVDVHIKYIRDHIDKKFPTKLIHTVSGVGYMAGVRTRSRD